MDHVAQLANLHRSRQRRELFGAHLIGLVRPLQPLDDLIGRAKLAGRLKSTIRLARRSVFLAGFAARRIEKDVAVF